MPGRCGRVNGLAFSSHVYQPLRSVIFCQDTKLELGAKTLPKSTTGGANVLENVKHCPSKGLNTYQPQFDQGEASERITESKKPADPMCRLQDVAELQQATLQ